MRCDWAFLARTVAVAFVIGLGLCWLATLSVPPPTNLGGHIGDATVPSAAWTEQ